MQDTTKLRYKMYKAGKKWIISGVAFAASGAINTAQTLSVLADDNLADPRQHKVVKSKDGQVPNLNQSATTAIEKATDPANAKAIAQQSVAEQAKDDQVAQEQADKQAADKATQEQADKEDTDKEAEAEAEQASGERPVGPDNSIGQSLQSLKDLKADAGFGITDIQTPAGYPNQSTTNGKYIFSIFRSQSSASNYVVFSIDRENPGPIYVTYYASNKSQGTEKIPVGGSAAVPGSYYTAYNNGGGSGSITSSQAGGYYLSGVFSVKGQYTTRYTNALSFTVPILVPQTTSYVDESGATVKDRDGNEVPSFTQKGLTGQKYTTGGAKVVPGKYVQNPSDNAGFMSPFGVPGTQWITEWHNSAKQKVIYTEKEDGYMDYVGYTGNSVDVRGTLKPGEKYAYSKYDINNPYIKPTRNIEYVYHDLGKLVPNVPGAEPVPYPNDENDPTKAGLPIIPKIDGYKPVDGAGNILKAGDPYPIDVNKPGVNTIVNYVANDSVPVTPESPKEPGTPINPDNPDGPKWPKGTDKASLIHDDITRTIKYVNPDGKEIAPAVTQTAKFTRTAIVDVEDGIFLGYDTNGDGKVDTKEDADSWVATNESNNFDKVTSPDLKAKGWNNPEPAVVDAKTVQVSDKNSTVTVTYNNYVRPVGPDNPQVPGEPMDPSNPDGPKWPEGVDKASLTKDVTRTIKYSDADTNEEVAPTKIQSVKFNRYALVDMITGKIIGYDTNNDEKVDVTDAKEAWVAQGNAEMPAVTSPDLATQGFNAPSQAEVAAKTVAGKDDNETVEITYSQGSQVVTPENPQEPGKPINPANPDGPKWPEGTDKASLIKEAKRTIQYLDKDTKKSISADVVQTVNFKRGAVVNTKTGKITGYDLDGDGKVDTKDPEKAWQADGSTTVAAVKSPDMTKTGFTPPSVDEVPADTLTAADENKVVQVFYGHGNKPVTPDNPQEPGKPINPDNPDGPKWPDGVDKASLVKEVTRTINYLDDASGDKVLDANVQTVTFSRHALVDTTNGKLVGYDTNNDGEPDVKADQADDAWLADDADEFAAVKSPDLSDRGFTAPDKDVASAKVAGKDADSEVNVYYSHFNKPIGPDTPQEPGKPIDPNKPDGPKWPEGTDKDSLMKTVSRTINYLDGQSKVAVAKKVVQTADYTRYVLVDMTNGTIAGYDTNGDGKVDTKEADLAWVTKDKTEFGTVTSPDLSVKGYQAPSQAEVAGITLTPMMDNTDVNVTYDRSFSPLTPDTPQEPGKPINPNNPDGPKWPEGSDKDGMVKQVKRTIEYRDAQTNETVADKIEQAVTYNRYPIVDMTTGDIVGYDTNNDGKVDETDGLKAWQVVDGQAKVDAITSPDLSKQGYEAPSTAEVTATTLTPEMDNETIKVTYGHTSHKVSPEEPQEPGKPINPANPDGPKWPKGVDKESLTKAITRTINYLDGETSDEVAPQVNQTVNFKRYALVDGTTGMIIGYDTNDDGKADVTESIDPASWLADGSTKMDEVKSPDLTSKGYYAPSTTQVDAEDVKADGHSQVINVTYGRTMTPVGPDNPQEPGKPINPANPDGPKWPEGTDKDSLAKTVKRTINFLDAEDQHQVTDTITQSANFERYAIVDTAKGTLVGYDTNGDGKVDVKAGDDAWLALTDTTFPAVKVPTMKEKGYVKASVDAIDEVTVKGADKDTNIDVMYMRQVTPVGPDNPQEPGKPINPDNPDGPKWPEGVDAKSLAKTVKRTIEYVDNTGAKVAKEVVQKADYQRFAFVDETTGKLVGYAPTADGTAEFKADDVKSWGAVGSITADKVISPDLSKQNFNAPSIKEVAAKELTVDLADETVTVTYDRGMKPIGPDTPQEPGKPINPANPDGPKWPKGVDKDSLTKTVKRTVNYLDADTQRSIADQVVQKADYERYAVVDMTTGKIDGYDTDGDGKVDTTDGNAAWLLVKDTTNEVPAVTSPDLSKEGYEAPSVAQVDAKTLGANDDDQTIDVTYGHTSHKVSPEEPQEPGKPINPANPDGPKWPKGVDKESLTKAITRTINYLDGETSDEVAPQVNQTVNFKRYALVDGPTGMIIGYDTNDDDKVDVREEIDPASWLADGSTKMDEVKSPDLTSKGYYAPSTTQVDAEDVKADGHSQVINVTYGRTMTPVGPDNPQEPGKPINPANPDGPKWPEGTDKDSLAKTVKRTINFIDNKGKTVSESITQSANFKRYAIIDTVKGTLVGYDTNGDGKVDVKDDGNASWLADGDVKAPAVTAPDLSKEGYVTPSIAEIEAITLTPDYNEDPINVVYNREVQPIGPDNPQEPGKPINPANPDGPKWPEGTDKDSLTKTVTRTVKYLDAENHEIEVADAVKHSVTFNRYALVDMTTGKIDGYDIDGDGKVDTTDDKQAWITKDNVTMPETVSPDLSKAGYNAPDQATVAAKDLDPNATDEVIEVYYGHESQMVTPDTPQEPGKPINPANPDGPKWPEGTDAKSLVKTVTRTINFIDQDGVKIGDSKVQSATFHHSVIVDAATGEILGYDTNTDGKVDTTDINESWQLAEGSNANFDALTIPESMTYNDRDYTIADPKQTIDAMTVVGADKDITIDVKYGINSLPNPNDDNKGNNDDDIKPTPGNNGDNNDDIKPTPGKNDDNNDGAKPTPSDNGNNNDGAKPTPSGKGNNNDGAKPTPSDNGNNNDGANLTPNKKNNHGGIKPSTDTQGNHHASRKDASDKTGFGFLPQTDMEKGFWMSVLGGILGIASIAYGFILRKKNKK